MYVDYNNTSIPLICCSGSTQLALYWEASGPVLPAKLKMDPWWGCRSTDAADLSDQEF
jgi:hypothetical protein